MTDKVPLRFKGAIPGSPDFGQYAEAALRLAEEASRKQDRIIELLTDIKTLCSLVTQPNTSGA